jgi:magnesium chelatase subunit I
LKQIQGLFERLSPLGIKGSDCPQKVVAGAEFLLEGMVAHRKLSRSEQREFSAAEKPQRKQERVEPEPDYEDWQQPRRSRRGGYN